MEIDQLESHLEARCAEFTAQARAAFEALTSEPPDAATYSKAFRRMNRAREDVGELLQQLHAYQRQHHPALAKGSLFPAVFAGFPSPHLN